MCIRDRGRDIPDTTRQEAAELAVLHSSQNGGAKVAVDTTEVKNIWKANGAKPGMVLYEVYTTVYAVSYTHLLKEDNQNFLLMHAVGVNVSGQIASVIAGGMILSLFG